MYHVLIKGASYKGLDFNEREQIRKALRNRLEAQGIRFVEYPWIWDEEDRCLLLAGSYEKLEDAHWWIEAIKSAGLDICTRTSLPGDPPGPKETFGASRRAGRPV